jgi:hypothetical protein
MDTQNTNPQTIQKHQPRLNILPIVLIGAILFLLFKVDIKSAIESPQFQKNILYIKTTAQRILPKLPKINADNFKKAFEMPKLPELNANMSSTGPEQESSKEYPKVEDLNATN